MEVWVKATVIDNSDREFKDVVILLDKDDKPIYYTAVDMDLVQTKETE